MNFSPKTGEAVCKHLLRPVIRFLVRRRMSFQQFVDLAKLVFVEVATDELSHEEDKANISRISIMTGLNRREVSRISRGEIKPIDSGPSLIVRIMSYWEQNSPFCTAAKRPRTLSYGDDSSEFSKLVSLVNKDTKPGTVLFEMERIGLVKRTSRGVKLVRQSHKRSGDPDRQFALLSRELSTLIRLAEENMPHENNPPHVHVRTEYDNIYTEDLPKIREWLQRESARFHKKGRDFLSKRDKDLDYRPNKQAGGRVVISCYSYIEE